MHRKSKDIVLSVVKVILHFLAVILHFLGFVADCICRALFSIVKYFLVICFSIIFLFTMLPDIRALLGYTHATTLSETVVAEQLEAISEFATYEYTYTNHVDCRDAAMMLGHEVWLTEHSFSFDYSGTIKAGYDFGEIVIAEIDDLEQKIYIHLPVVVILSNEISIDMESYSDTNNINNPLRPREVLEYLYSRKAPEQEKALEQGLFALAEENAMSLICVALEPFGYEVVFI